MGSFHRRLQAIYERVVDALPGSPSREVWWRVVLAADQPPQFGDVCPRCGEVGAGAGREDVDIEAESGVQPGARLGVVCLSVPRWRVCRGWQWAVGGVVLASLGALLVAVVLRIRDLPNGHTKYYSLGWRDWRSAALLVACACMLWAFIRAWSRRLQVFERAEGISYLFLDRGVAQAFARRNPPLLPRTSPELLSSPDHSPPGG
jgi:hypothetical protein